MSIRKVYLIFGYILAITGISFRIYSIIPSITNYPFWIGWSEPGRIFAAYQVYAPLITGKYLSLPWLDPGRSILDGMVFLVPNLPIWAYRLWVNILFLVFNCLAAVLIVRKALGLSTIPERQQKELVILLSLWGTLFLLQAPVYYHVLVGVIPVLWFYDEKHPVRNLVIIILCSMWQGLCRVNWFTMPAVVAVLLHVLRMPYTNKQIWKYIKWPLVYAIFGGVSSFAVFWLYIKTMGYVVPFLDPNMNYAYFLYKLWPNAGYIGLLPGIFLISFPVLLITLLLVWKYRKKIHWPRQLVLAGILGFFFAISTLISLRAGGGYDLHNYDTFLLLLLMTACFFGMDAVYWEEPGTWIQSVPVNLGVVALLLIIPTLVAYPKTSPQVYTANAQTAQALQEIKKTLQSSTVSVEHPILFIDQRQLLVFHLLSDENIYIPYEKNELMEMAMARNQSAKQQFISDLENHKFSFIVSEVLTIWAKHFDPNFFERDWYENNVWVDFVGIPVLNYYMPVYINRDFGVAIYVPKQ